MDAHPITASQIGLVVDQSTGSVDLLVPAGDEERPLQPLHEALIGAAIGILNSKAVFLENQTRYRVFMTPRGEA